MNKLISIPKNKLIQFNELNLFIKEKGINFSQFLVDSAIKELHKGDWSEIYKIWKERKEDK